MEFTLGSGQLIPGFEKAVEGMEKGESTKVTIPSEEAYGEPREDLIISVPRENMPDGVTPEVGMQLQVNQPDEIGRASCRGRGVIIDSRRDSIKKKIVLA